MIDRMTDGPAGHAPSLTTVALTVAVSHPTVQVTVVAPAGELDLLTSPILDRCVQYELHDRRHTQLILDVSHLSFCGVAGLRSLLTARELANYHRTYLYLVSCPRVGRLLHLTGLHDQFVICSDVSVALAFPGSRGQLQVS